MVALDIENLKRWAGRSEAAADSVTPVPVAALRATLDLDQGAPRAGEPLPLPWQWLYFLPIHRQSALSENGHPRLGDFIPPVPLPRRMYAGGRMYMHQPLRIGDAIQRISTIADVSYKQGSSGPLVFLQIRHEISNQQGLAITETQDIVYREESRPGIAAPAAQAAPATQQWLREFQADPILLFRFSALTFNGHRIHYDYPYVTGVEGYPGLVVHGPLLAVLLLDLLQRQLPASQVREFSFRALHPVFNMAPFYLCGGLAGQQSASLWVRDADGVLCLSATAELA